MHIERALITLAMVAALTGCSGSHQSDSASPSPAAVVSDVPVTATPAAALTDASSAASPVSEALGSPPSTDANAASPNPTPSPTATPYANLLDFRNGAIVRSYPATIRNGAGEFDEHGFNVKAGSTGPYVYVYELPGVATLTGFDISVPAPEASETPSKVTIAASTTGVDTGFADIASLTSSATIKTPTLVPVANATARWLRITVEGALEAPISGLYAYGTLAPRPATAPAIAGTYIEQLAPYGELEAGTTAYAPKPEPSSAWYVRVVTPPGGIGGTYCLADKLGDAIPGTLDGRTWSWTAADQHTGRLIVNDEGTTIVGEHPGNGGPTYYTRTNDRPKYCDANDGGGKGPTHVLVLDAAGLYARYPVDAYAKDVPSMHFTHLAAGLLDGTALDKSQIVILNGLCKPAEYLSLAQIAMLLAWTHAGHKLAMYTADMCGSGSDFAFLPYPFLSSNPGAGGASSHTLIEVENDALGSLDVADKEHHFDPQPWATAGNQIGDADTVTTHDAHWCGHLFGTNAKNVNGFMQMYAPYGRGLIIYDGFDHDDDDNSGYQRMRRLELETPVDGFLPCTQNAGLAFLIEPNSTSKFTPGKPQTIRASMQLLANQGWHGHVTIAPSGDFPARVKPDSFDIVGNTKALSVVVSIPASAKPGSYAVIVNGTGNDGTKAQATINLLASTPLVKQLKLQRRIRLYGIHFDVDSAHIQSQSEPVIKEVAEILRSEPQWHFRVEGHTDPDGGVTHNQTLSQHRAESVVADLVKRYHVVRARLVPVGYGLSRPVATNSTAAGKALNRRVELYRL